MIRKIWEERKEYVILMIVLISIGVFVYFLANANNLGKTDTTKDYIYTAEEVNKNKFTNSRLPFINLKGDFYTNLNQTIKSDYDNAVSNIDMKFDYTFYMQNNILSLVIRTYKAGETDTVHPTYTIYNIDLKNNKLLTNEELLSQLKITSNDVIVSVDNKIASYYEIETRNQYLPKDLCDLDCYKNGFGLDKIDYIKDGKLFIADKNALKIYIKFRLNQYLSEDDSAPIEPNVFDIVTQ